MTALLFACLSPILASGGAVLAIVALHVALAAAVTPPARTDKPLGGFLEPPRCTGCGMHVGPEPCPRCGCWWGRP